jgi:hypothetical protein
MGRWRVGDFMTTARSSQLTLNIRTETEAAWMSRRGIFSLSYLRQHLAGSKHFPSTQKWAMAAKRLEFTNATPSNELVAALRELAKELTASAPAYLRPPAQELALLSPADCLAILERVFNWEAEKLYGVEAQGPFDEF